MLHFHVRQARDGDGDGDGTEAVAEDVAEAVAEADWAELMELTSWLAAGWLRTLQVSEGEDEDEDCG